VTSVTNRSQRDVIGHGGERDRAVTNVTDYRPIYRPVRFKRLYGFIPELGEVMVIGFYPKTNF